MMMNAQVEQTNYSYVQKSRNVIEREKQINEVEKELGLNLSLIREKYKYNSLVYGPSVFLLDDNLTPNEKIFLYQIDMFSKKYGFAWPKFKILAMQMGISERAIKKIEKKLVNGGYLLKISGLDKGQTNTYKLMPPYMVYPFLCQKFNDEEDDTAKFKFESFSYFHRILNGTTEFKKDQKTYQIIKKALDFYFKKLEEKDPKRFKIVMNKFYPEGKVGTTVPTGCELQFLRGRNYSSYIIIYNIITNNIYKKDIETKNWIEFWKEYLFDFEAILKASNHCTEVLQLTSLDATSHTEFENFQEEIGGPNENEVSTQICGSTSIGPLTKKNKINSTVSTSCFAPSNCNNSVGWAKRGGTEELTNGEKTLMKDIPKEIIYAAPDENSQVLNKKDQLKNVIAEAKDKTAAARQRNIEKKRARMEFKKAQNVFEDESTSKEKSSSKSKNVNNAEVQKFINFYERTYKEFMGRETYVNLDASFGYSKKKLISDYGLNKIKIATLYAFKNWKKLYGWRSDIPDTKIIYKTEEIGSLLDKVGIELVKAGKSEEYIKKFMNFELDDAEYQWLRGALENKKPERKILKMEEWLSELA